MEASQVTQPTLTAIPAPPQHEQCDQCGAAVESTQRYCVACGTHRRHVRDPAARYLATRTSRARTAAAAGARPPAGTRSGSSSLLTAVIVAAVPLAIGLGVLVGRSSNTNDAKLLAALRNQKPQVVRTASTGSTAATETASSSGRVSSTFPLQSGYAVELQTLPGTGTTTADIASAEHAAKAKGAPKVGLIVQTQYTVTPAPASGAYVVYAGAYKSKAQASQELSKLGSKFPKAVVIQVKSTTSSSGSNATASGAKVVARTQYGVVHQVSGYHPNAAAEKAGGQIVSKIQKTMGKSYTNAQKGLPDVIPVP